MDGNGRRILGGGALGAVAGLIVGVALAAASPGAGAPGRTGPPGLEATHLPPLLTAPGEAVVLRYDVYCVGSDDPTAACDPAGTVWLRAGDSGAFQPLALAPEPGVANRLALRVPPAVARSGFSYFAVLRDARSGASTTVPAGGAGAPERSLPLVSPVTVDLGGHRFGSTRPADARAAAAAWGDRPGDAGLEESGPDATPIGASSFDVDGSGRVTVLDEAHRRLLRFDPAAGVRAVPVAIDGTMADLAVASDGASYVLETEGSRLVRAFGPDGRALTAVPGGSAASGIRLGPLGPVVLDAASGQWTAPAAAGSRPELGRPLPDGSQVVVYEPDTGEVRVALVSGSTVTRSWRILSATPLGEVQLAQPAAGNLVVVVRTYTDAKAEFAVLVLGRGGLLRLQSLPAADWAETAPLARFRLVGSSLYQLGSTPAGMFVDRFDLGVS